MSSSKILASYESATFSTLPEELRIMIWDLTFEQRTLTITPHDVFLPRRGGFCEDSTDMRYGSLDDHKHCATVFTAHLGIHTVIPDEKTTPDARSDATFRGCSIYHSSPKSSHKAPPGPVALYVHQDSRAYALEHYQLAFRSVMFKHAEMLIDPEFEAFFNSSPVFEPRIWVNFALDRIFLLPTALKWSMPGECRNLSMTMLDPEDRQNIQKLAFPACWTERHVRAVVHARSDNDSRRHHEGKFLHELAVFTASKQMTIYTVSCKSHSKHGSSELQMAKEILEQMSIKAQMSVESGDTMFQHWVTKLPETVVSKEMEFAERITPYRVRETRLQWRDPAAYT